MATVLLFGSYTPAVQSGGHSARCRSFSCIWAMNATRIAMQSPMIYSEYATRRALSGKKHLCKQHVNRKPGRAGHKWSYEDCPAPVLNTLQRPGCHYGRNRTSEPQKAWAGMPCRITHHAHGLIHHIYNPGHIAAVPPEKQGPGTG